ncbi:DNA-binding response regulator [Blautia sp. An249]|uniref:response regulator transcription factor n=1 Tax=Blautia sp. An249 TaxID=1965603 RepID=UPI000B3707C2|nr:response regulator transcription factor [Blautia sp. An249]OUO81108.1 DNA-binding response regulator [Blautia sp. An249]
MRLLLAEDEKEMADALEAVLKHNRYLVDTVSNGTDAYDWIRNTDYDGVILDIMMPQMSGLEVLERIRREGNPVPVLLLTAKSEVDDKVQGLDLGADDYLTKPFAMKELLARIRAMTRRKPQITANLLQIGELVLNRETFQLEYKNKSLYLGKKEYQMMELFMENPGMFISQEQIFSRIWGYNSETNSQVVWVNISYLRKKIADLQAPFVIKALRGTGYRLEEQEYGT